MPQRKDEISLSVMERKQKKVKRWVMVEKPKTYNNGCSCSEALNRGTFNDYPFGE